MHQHARGGIVPQAAKQTIPCTIFVRNDAGQSHSGAFILVRGYFVVLTTAIYTWPPIL
jgi:hypothetical protein